MTRNEPPAYRFTLRVYWEDTDAGGIVFYANYLKFFERARTEWLRSLGHQQEPMRVQGGVMFVVTDTTVRYLRPARLDDQIDVTVDVKHAGRAQLTLAQQAWKCAGSNSITNPIANPTANPTANPITNSRANAVQSIDASRELLAEGTIRIACVDARTFKPARIPIAVCDSLASSSRNDPRMTQG